MQKLLRLLFILCLLLGAGKEVFATKITVGTQQIQNWNYTAVGTTVKLRIYNMQAFVASDNTIIQSGDPNGNKFYKEVSMTVTTITLGTGEVVPVVLIPMLTLDSTIDGQDVKTSTYGAYWFDSSNRRLGPYEPFQQFRMSNIWSNGTTTTWNEIAVYNRSVAPILAYSDTYPKETIDRLIANINGLINPMTSLGDTIFGGNGGSPMRLPATTSPTVQFLGETLSGMPAWTSLTSSHITTALGYTPFNVTGGTFTGPVILQADPVVNLGAATKQYVDNHTGGLTSINTSTVPAQVFSIAGSFPDLVLTDNVGAGTHSFGLGAPIRAGSGGTGMNSYSTGSILYAQNSGTLTQLGIGSPNYTIISNGSAPTWGLLNLTTSVTGVLPGTGGGTNSANFQITGPTALRTYTFPDASTTILTTTNAVTAPQGGTGISVYTLGDILYANSTSTLARLGIGAATTVLHGGTTPGYSAVSLATDVTGVLPNGNLANNSITLTGTANQVTISGGGPLSLGGTATFSLPQSIHTAATPTFGGLTLSGAPTVLTLTGTVFTAGSNAELNHFLDNPSGTLTFPGGASTSITNQRTNLFNNRTYNATSAGLTVTNAATVAILGAPTAGSGNITITNPYALWIQAGDSAFGGNIRILGSSSGYISLASPATVTTPIVLKWPAVPGTNGQVLATDGGTLSGGVYTINSSWINNGAGGGGGVTSINGNAGVQTLTVGSTGTDLAWTVPDGSHVELDVPNAGASARGVMSTGTQTLAGAKTFSGAFTASSTATLTGAVTTGSTVGLGGTLTLVTGSTSVAPMLFGGSGSLLTSPVAHAVEWDGTNLYVTQATGPTRKTIAFVQSLAGAVSGPVGSTSYAGILPINLGGTGTAVSTGAATTGMFLRYDSTLNSGAGGFAISADGTAIQNLVASNVTTGTLPTNVLCTGSNCGTGVGIITNAQVSTTAAIGWSKIDKAGSSLADLTTRSASALSSGTLLDTLVSSNVQLLTPTIVAFTGSGTNDFSADGTGYTQTVTHTFTVIIDNAAPNPQTFKWQQDSGAFTTGVAITPGSAQTLALGETITFTLGTGHILNDQWIVTQYSNIYAQGKNKKSGYAGLDSNIKLLRAQGQEVWSVTDLTEYATTSGSGSTALQSTITSPSNGQVLTYNSGNWINMAASNIGVLNTYTQAGLPAAVQGQLAYVTNNTQGIWAYSSNGTGQWYAANNQTVNAREFGAKGDGSTDDTTALQNAINAAINSSTHRGVTVNVPAGDYFVTASLNVSNVSGFKFVGTGGNVRLIWNSGTNTLPLFLVTSCQYCEFANFQVMSNIAGAGSLGIGFKVVTDHNLTFVSRSNRFTNIQIDGGTNRVNKGFQIGNNGGTNNLNNDFNYFDHVSVLNYSGIAFSVEDTQAFGETFMDCECSANAGGGTACVDTHQNAGNGGSFKWYSGVTSGNTVADFYLGNPNNDSVIISGVNAETSTMLLKTGGPSSGQYPVILDGVRFSGDAGAFTGQIINYQLSGDLTIRNCYFNENATHAPTFTFNPSSTSRSQSFTFDNNTIIVPPASFASTTETTIFPTITPTNMRSNIINDNGSNYAVLSGAYDRANTPGNITDTAANNYYGYQANLSFAPTSNSSVTAYGLYGQLTLAPGGGATLSNAISGVVGAITANGGGTVSDMRGFTSNVTIASTQIVTNAYGTFANVANSSSSTTTGNLIGLYGKVGHSGTGTAEVTGELTGLYSFPFNQSTGKVDALYGVHIFPQNQSTGNVLAMYGTRVTPSNAAGTVGTYYGHYLDNLPPSTNQSYQFYANNGPSRFSAVAVSVVTKTTTYTATANDYTILCDATGGAFTVTLPAASAISGQILFIKKLDVSGNVVTISRAGGDTIEGATTKTLTGQYKSFVLVSDGSGIWYVKAST